jgi:predicted XRE-type DNA-binding protein
MSSTAALYNYVESSSSVCADMGLEGADERLTKAQLDYSVRQTLKELGLKPDENNELLEIKQPEVSNLMEGKYYLFSEGWLFCFLNKLNRKVLIRSSQRNNL